MAVCTTVMTSPAFSPASEIIRPFLFAGVEFELIRGIPRNLYVHIVRHRRLSL